MSNRRTRNNIKQTTINDIATGSGPENREFTAPSKIHVKDPHSKIIKEVNKGIVDQEGNLIGDGDSEFSLIAADWDANAYTKNTEEYNKNVLKLDKRFSEDIDMIGESILIRCFNERLYTKGGLLTSVPHTAVPKQGTGMYGEMQRIPKNYPLTNAGIIANISDRVSENTGLKKGDLVVINPSLVEERPKPGTDTTYLQTFFQHYNHNHIDDMDCYGYILVKHFDIWAKIKKESLWKT